MSRVSIQGDQNGTGDFTIKAPNSNVDRTLTLPDEAGSVLTDSSPASSIPGYGNQILGADFWYNVADKTGNGPVTTLERRNGSINGMSFDSGSGTFTFPQTGLWFIWIQGFLRIASGDFANLEIGLSTNGGNSFSRYTLAAGKGSLEYTVHNSVLINVTSTSGIKVNLRTESFASGTQLDGVTSDSRTGIGFIRLGDSS